MQQVERRGINSTLHERRRRAVLVDGLAVHRFEIGFLAAHADQTANALQCVANLVNWSADSCK